MLKSGEKHWKPMSGLGACKVRGVILLALVLGGAMFAAGSASAMGKLAGDYQLQAQNVEGDLSIEEHDGMFLVDIFTTNDGGLHFCFLEGAFVLEEKALVEAEPFDPEAGPFIIRIHDGFLEIKTDSPGACGLNQSLTGKYFPVK